MIFRDRSPIHLIIGLAIFGTNLHSIYPANPIEKHVYSRASKEAKKRPQRGGQKVAIVAGLASFLTLSVLGLGFCWWSFLSGRKPGKRDIKPPPPWGERRSSGVWVHSSGVILDESLAAGVG